MSIPAAVQMVPINAIGFNSLFLLDNKGAVYHNVENLERNFIGWIPLGGHDIRQIAVAPNADGRLEVFALGGNRLIYHQWQTQTNAVLSAWSGWTGNLILEGVKFKQVEARLTSENRIIVFALEESGRIYYITQAAVNGGGAPQGFNNWNGWDVNLLGGNNVQSLLAIMNPVDKLMELFALGGDNGIWRIRQLNQLVLNPGDSGQQNVWSGWDNTLAQQTAKPNLPLYDETYRTITFFTVLPDGNETLQIYALCEADNSNTSFQNIIITNRKVNAEPYSDWLGWEIFDNDIQSDYGPSINLTLVPQSRKDWGTRILSMAISNSVAGGINVFALFKNIIYYVQYAQEKPYPAYYSWAQTGYLNGEFDQIIVLRDKNPVDHGFVIAFGKGSNANFSYYDDGINEVPAIF